MSAITRPSLRALLDKGPLQPSYPVLPVVDEGDQTNVPGIYAVGELAGTPLVRLGLNAGHDAIQRIAPTLKGAAGTRDDQYDIVIIGSGSSGLAATVAARDLGLKVVTLEAAHFANTFVTMTKGKVLFAEPEDVRLRSRVWFEECTKEELLDKWRALRDSEGLDIREQERVTAVRGREDDFVVQTPQGEYPCRRVLLCLGKAGNPRKLGVPGEREHAERIHHKLLDPDDHTDQDIVIVGAGDVACEAAIALATPGHNRVTLSAIDAEFTYPKQRNIDAVRQLEAEGKLTILLGTRVTAFGAQTCTIEGDGDPREVRYDHAFEMIGAELPIRFLRDVGIRLNTDWPIGRYATLLAVFLAVYSLYSLKSFGKGSLTEFPFNLLLSVQTYDLWLSTLFSAAFAPFSFLFSAEQIEQLHADRGFQQGFLYSGLYTLVMGGFGYEALIRWRGKARDPRYQTYRFATLIGFQVAFFFIVNVIGVHAVGVKYAWRAWGLYQPFPLFFNTYFWWYDDPLWLMAFFIGFGLLGTFVAIPLLSRNHGKRFCTWVCGCGGLAETLGDRWRHLAAKGPRSRAWEFQGLVVGAAAFLIAAVLVGIYDTHGDNVWWYAYNYIVDFWLVAVIPIAVYPFFGGKVWCRYWCPLAAYNGLLAGWYGRLKIVANDQCITCTECSKYCQVGVDVMAFAKNSQPFDNSNTACIQCGICIDVCPMDVLSFETSDGLATKLIAEGRSTGLSA
ncbi:MAG: NAD(P)-binding domain-containing protein [Myxococcales bacterium]|nr:NAD(P)-binding domain-containing protein [Myxococcales bacterium]